MPTRNLIYSQLNSRSVETKRVQQLGKQLGAISIARLFLNTGIRVIYPFLPALARGLGVGTADITRLITIRNATGFLSPLFSPLSENYGRKAVMIGAMILFGGACLLVVFWPGYWVLGITLALIGLAKVIYDPAMQAHVGDVVPYAQRGKAIAITEYAWALALLLGAPAVGFAIQYWGWQAPFLGLGVLALGSVILLWRSLPDVKVYQRIRRSFSDWTRFLRKHPVVFFAVIYTALITLANEMLFIVFGTWMENSFELNLAGLGIAAAVIGGAELAGETIAGWSVDRFGKRPVVITTGLLNAAFYFLLPFSSSSLKLAMIALFLTFLCFEITVVGGMPLMTEIVPSARAVVMSLVVAAAALGRTLGAFVGIWVWDLAGFKISGLVWALLMAAAVIILALFIREG
ncbi:MAG: MFS transporter [Candidatus Promineifilaceae bacterium]|nr:MFS transporter [Candidatus Promineifilaceae bacterium]